MPAGVLKGLVQGTVALPGDIISLVRGVYDLGASGGSLDAFLAGSEKPTGLPTTEDVKTFFDKTLGIPLVPEGASDRRREAVKTAEFVGELGGAGTTAIAGTKAVARGAKRAASAAGDILAPDAPLNVQEPLAAAARSNAVPKRKRGAVAESAPAVVDGPGAIESVQFVELPDGKFATSTALQETSKVSVGFEQASTPEQAAHITAGLRKSPQEQLVAVVLDADDRPIQIVRHTIGLADQTSAEPFSLLGVSIGLIKRLLIFKRGVTPRGE